MGTYTGVVAVGGWGFIAAAAEGASSLCSEEGSQPMSRREGARWRLHAARDGLIGLKVEDGRRGIVLTLKKKKKNWNRPVHRFNPSSTSFLSGPIDRTGPEP